MILDTPERQFHDWMSGGVFMSKLYKKPVEVRLDGEALSAFLWRGKWLQVESVTKVRRKHSWRDPDPGDTFRVDVKGGGVYDLVKDKAGWVLERVWD